GISQARAELFALLKPHTSSSRIAQADPGGAHLGAQPLQSGGKTVEVDRDPARAQRVLGEIERKAVGVVERKRDLAGKPVAAVERPARLVEDREAALQRFAEASLLELQRIGTQRLRGVEFG